MIHTLKYAKKLEVAGVNRKQAEAHVSVLADFLEEEMATKGDIFRLDARIQQLEAKFDERCQQLELKITVKVGSMLAASVAILAALIQLK